MEDVLLSIILVVFPVLMYLVFSCYNSLNDRNIEKVFFVITIITSIYLSLKYNFVCGRLLLLCNIPILICYFKREWLLGVIVSLIILIYSYIMYDINVYVVSIKYVGYLITFLLLCQRKDFNYLFLKVSAIVQAFFISFEYFMNTYDDIHKLLGLIIYIFIIYGITFFCLYLFKLASDVSSLYKTINKFSNDSKLKDSLFKLTHEIKNPIAVCKGYLDMINLDDKLKSRKYIDIIKSEIDRSLNVIADFMEYSKIKVNKEEIDLVMLLDEIYESFEILMRDNNICFKYKSDCEEVYLQADYDRLKQVFVNVIKNSVESIEQNGIINIELFQEANKAFVKISDNGIGMNSEELSNIKEMFFTTKKNGTGLGVALSNEIIMAHNGKMTYESIKNKGTDCIIELPL